MITFEDITKLFSRSLEGKFCIEIEFLLKDEPKYQTCWMGKMPDKENKEKEGHFCTGETGRITANLELDEKAFNETDTAEK